MSYNWQELTTNSSSIEISGLDAGLYEIEVIAINALGQTSSPALLTQAVSPQQNIPAQPQNVSITPIDEFTGLLTWDQSDDVQVYVGGRVLIYHEPVLSGATWESSAELIKNVSGSQSSAAVPLLEGTYLVKFSTSQNVRSLLPGQTVIRLSEPDPMLTISTIQEDVSGFTGEVTGVYYDPVKLGRVLNVGTTFDSFAPDGDFDDLPVIDFIGGVKPTGQYVFSSVVDAGAVCDVNLVRRLKISPYNTALLFDYNTADIDTWGDFDGIDTTDANATLYVRSTDNDPSTLSIDSIANNIDTWTDFDYGFASWSEWRICTNNLLRGRAFQFKVVLSSAQENQNLVVTELGVTAKLRQRTERSASPISSGAAAYQVNFVNNFHAAPAVTITPLQVVTGDYHVITTPTNSGFQVTFFDSAGNPVNRVFNYMAVGYGRRF